MIPKYHLNFNNSPIIADLYVDDVEVAKDTQPGLVSSEGGLYIGTGTDMALGTYWSGLIDEVRIYNRAVSP